MLQYLQTFQLHSCAYVLENVPPLGDSQPIILVARQQIKAWIEEQVQVDAVAVGSRAHCFRWLWTNLVLPQVLYNAY
jgi:hypothetical protein